MKASQELATRLASEQHRVAEATRAEFEAEKAKAQAQSEEEREAANSRILEVIEVSAPMWEACNSYLFVSHVLEVE